MDIWKKISINVFVKSSEVRINKSFKQFQKINKHIDLTFTSYIPSTMHNKEDIRRMVENCKSDFVWFLDEDKLLYCKRMNIEFLKNDVNYLNFERVGNDKYEEISNFDISSVPDNFSEFFDDINNAIIRREFFLSNYNNELTMCGLLLNKRLTAISVSNQKILFSFKNPLNRETNVERRIDKRITLITMSDIYGISSITGYISEYLSKYYDVEVVNLVNEGILNLVKSGIVLNLLVNEPYDIFNNLRKRDDIVFINWFQTNPFYNSNIFDTFLKSKNDINFITTELTDYMKEILNPLNKEVDNYIPISNDFISPPKVEKKNMYKFESPIFTNQYIYFIGRIDSKEKELFNLIDMVRMYNQNKTYNLGIRVIGDDYSKKYDYDGIWKEMTFQRIDIVDVDVEYLGYIPFNEIDFENCLCVVVNSSMEGQPVIFNECICNKIPIIARYLDTYMLQPSSYTSYEKFCSLITKLSKEDEHNQIIEYNDMIYNRIYTKRKETKLKIQLDDIFNKYYKDREED